MLGIDSSKNNNFPIFRDHLLKIHSIKKEIGKIGGKTYFDFG